MPDLALNQRQLGYRCMDCGRELAGAHFRYTCDICKSNLDAVFDYQFIRRHWKKADLVRNPDRSIWRYLPLIPTENSPKNRSLQVGGTPLVQALNSAAELNLSNLWIKDDTRLPTASLKDRATEVGVQHANENGFSTIVTASTGNAAASLAGLAAHHGRRAVILAPASAPVAKLTQILQYGAVLCPVAGNYDAAFDLAAEVAEKYGWYSRSTGLNPVMSEGKKTVALEIAEQLDWQVADYIFVPVGDGCIIGGVYKGFYDLLQLGWIERLPKIVAVQAAGSAAIVKALVEDKPIASVTADTIADSIAVDLPRDGLKALRSVRESDGFGIVVTDDEILSAQQKLSRSTGIFAEPAAAAAFAGLMKAVNTEKISANSSIVVLATGSGLKDIAAAGKMVSVPPAVKPNLESFSEFMQSQEPV